MKLLKKLTDLNNMTKINDLDDETFAKVDMTLNQFGFENYCGACDFFETDDCPYKDKKK